MWNLPVTPCISWLPTFEFQSPNNGWGIDLDYCDVEWFALKTNRYHSVVSETEPKYCFLDSLIDYDGYSFSSKGFLHTVVDKRSSELNSPIHIQFSGFLKCWCSLLPSPAWLHPFTLIRGPNIPASYAILFFTASFTTRHTHNWTSFLLWPSLCILSGAISPLFSSSILDTYQPGGLIFCSHTFLPFHTVHGVLKERILEWFAIPFSSGPHLLELSKGGQEIPRITSKFGLQVKNEAGQRLTEFCQSFDQCYDIDHSKHPLPTTQEMTLHMDIIRWSTLKSDWLYSLQPKMEKLYTVSKYKTGSWLWFRSWAPYCTIQT